MKLHRQTNESIIIKRDVGCKMINSSNIALFFQIFIIQPGFVDPLYFNAALTLLETILLPYFYARNLKLIHSKSLYLYQSGLSC